MKKILVLLTLFHILNSTLAACPDTPITSITTCTCASPQTITPTSPSMTRFPSGSFDQMSLSFTVKYVNNACTASKTSYLSLGTGSSNLLYIYYESGSLKVSTFGGSGTSVTSMSQTNVWVSVFVSLKLDSTNSQLSIDAAVPGSANTYSGAVGSTSSHYDQNTVIYLCSGNSGSSAIDAIGCSISSLSVYYSTSSSVKGFAGSFKPNLSAFYPLVNGPVNTLYETISITSPGYLGDSSSSATSTTVPTWDSSNNFVTITSLTQFLTFPMPNLQAGELSTYFSFTVSTWINVNTAGNILSILSSDKTKTKLTLAVDSSNAVTIKVTNSQASLESSLTMTFNTWHLVDVTVFVTASASSIAGTVSIDSSFAGFSLAYSTTYGFATGDILRIGDSSNSFKGSVSVVMIMAPGSAVLRGGSDVCSSTASLEVGSNSLAIKCDGSNGFYDLENKCYATCPSSTTAVTLPYQNFCFSTLLPAPAPTGGAGNTGNTGGNGSTEVVESSSDGLSGGAIAGIVVGSIAGIVLVGGGALYLSARRKKVGRKVKSIPEPTTIQVSSP